VRQKVGSSKTGGRRGGGHKKFTGKLLSARETTPVLKREEDSSGHNEQGRIKKKEFPNGRGRTLGDGFEEKTFRSRRGGKYRIGLKKNAR